MLSQIFLKSALFSLSGSEKELRNFSGEFNYFSSFSSIFGLRVIFYSSFSFAFVSWIIAIFLLIFGNFSLAIFGVFFWFFQWTCARENFSRCWKWKVWKMTSAGHHFWSLGNLTRDSEHMGVLAFPYIFFSSFFFVDIIQLLICSRKYMRKMLNNETEKGCKGTKYVRGTGPATMRFPRA